MIEKEILNDNSAVTANSKQIELLKKHFPNCFDKNGLFIPHKMEEIVGKSELDLSKESYSLNWLGKSYARLLANEDPLTLLKEDKEHNAKPENKQSENLLIKGDNLEVLKHLKNVYGRDGGQIKMIYIDPPYNTGSDGFVYNDDRKFTPEQLSKLAGIEADEAKRILEFTQSKANSHSAWLTFMYPRLYIARELLKEDGVIFISIDDNEQAQLKMLCDEVFGEENFIGAMIWKNATDNNPTNIATEHESIIVYGKSKNDLEGVWKSRMSDVKDLLVNIGEQLIRENKDLDTLQKKYTKWFRENKYQLGELDRYKYIDFGGVYTGSQSVHNPGKDGYRYDVIHPETQQPCKEPLMGYRFPKTTMDQLLLDEKILFGNDHNKIIELKVYAKDYFDKLSSVFELDGRLGANELRALFPEEKKVFTNPKPTELVKKLISFVATEQDSVLDFFAGSGTTAHAVMKLNAEDGGNRKYITVQIPEAIDAKNNKVAYDFVNNKLKKEPMIFEITKERLQRAAAKIKNENPESLGDFGFKIFETTQIFEGYLDEIEELEENITLFDGSKLNEDEIETLLTTWKVYDGIPLMQALQTIKLSDYKAHYHDKTIYFMDKGFDIEVLKAFIEKMDTDAAFKPAKMVLFGYNFDSKHQRETKEALKSYTNKKSIELDVIVRY